MYVRLRTFTHCKHHQGLCSLLFSNSGVGSLTPHKNQIGEGAVRRDSISSLSKKTRKFNRLQMSSQRQHFLLSYLKTLSVGLAGVWLPDLLLSRQVLSLLRASVPCGAYHSISKSKWHCQSSFSITSCRPENRYNSDSSDLTDQLIESLFFWLASAGFLKAFHGLFKQVQFYFVYFLWLVSLFCLSFSFWLAAARVVTAGSTSSFPFKNIIALKYLRWENVCHVGTRSIHLGVFGTLNFAVENAF